MPILISRPQLAKLHATLADLGVLDRTEKLRLVGAVLYRPVESTSDLSRDEARAVIDVLVSVGQRDEPATYVRELIERGERNGPVLPLDEGAE